MPSLKALRKYLLVIALFSMLSFAFVSPLSPIVTMLSDSGLKPITPRDQLIHEILAYVPPNASIITHNNLFPHVSSRINAYVAPTIGPIWNGNPSECRRFTDEILAKVDFVLVDIKSDPFAGSVVFSLMQENHGFRAFVSADGVILFKKNYTGDVRILVPYYVRYDYTVLSLYCGEITETPNSMSRFVLYFNGSLGSSPLFWHGPRSLLPSGKYNVTLRLKINGTGEMFTTNICSNNGQTVLASETFSAGSYTRVSVWSNHTFTLILDKPLVDFEIRTINLSDQADVFLDYIDVRQIDS
jgi:hypothetical protein